MDWQIPMLSQAWSHMFCQCKVTHRELTGWALTQRDQQRANQVTKFGVSGYTVLESRSLSCSPDQSFMVVFHVIEVEEQLRDWSVSLGTLITRAVPSRLITGHHLKECVWIWRSPWTLSEWMKRTPEVIFTCINTPLEASFNYKYYNLCTICLSRVLASWLGIWKLWL